MRNKSWITYLLILLPFIVGALASFIMQWMWNPVPIFLFKIDVGMMAFIAGIFITLFLMAFRLGAAGAEKRASKLIEDSLRESE